MNKAKIIIGISGASGIIYAVRLLEVLQSLNVETHLVITKSAELTRAYETSLSSSYIKKLATFTYNINDISAAIASGSYKTTGMIIAPCSMKTLSEVAIGGASNLLTRAADVILKERRRLVILPREAPLHRVHLQNMLTVTDMGGIIFPPVPAFYQKPQNISDIINDTVGRVLDLFDIEHNLLKRWQGFE